MNMCKKNHKKRGFKCDLIKFEILLQISDWWYSNDNLVWEVIRL